ncbi:MAF-LIKE PROTEIN [Salix viminalis]|uniref:MAF-LIKE PROTEIN n=1 Tax=Salix viminalis TaxID=40686 RepID=A0A9Q0NZ92_SALVM|nr:MAF-LIKE PROTEIN [Salix viminalis]
MELEKEIEGKMTTCNSSFKIILGSSSLARRQILNEMGYEFTVVTADIDEKSIRRDKPEELVMALAEAKANAIIERLQIEGHVEEDAQATLLITADTVVVSHGMVREKPNNKEEAREFIKGYSGGHAAVIGSVVVSNLTTGIRKGAWEKAEVYFHEIPDEIIDSVVNFVNAFSLFDFVSKAIFLCFTVFNLSVDDEMCLRLRREVHSMLLGV